MPGRPYKPWEQLKDQRPSRRRPGYGIVIPVTETLPIPPVPDVFTESERAAWRNFWESSHGIQLRRSSQKIVNAVAHALAQETCDEINALWNYWFGHDFTDVFGET